MIIEREPTGIKFQESYFRGFSKVGYENARSLIKDTLNIDYSSLVPVVESIISRTESLYKSALENRLEKLGIPVFEANRIDLGFASMGNEFDVFLREDLLIPTLESTVKGLGIDLKHFKIEQYKKMHFFYDLIDRFRSTPRTKIILDLEYRSDKHINPMCIPVRIPEESRLILKPLSGYTTFLSLLHEFGHALNFAFMDPSLPSVFEYGGDLSVSESHAYLFEQLPFNPEWLKDFIPLKDSIDEFMEFANFKKVLNLRWAIAMFLTEFELDSTKTVEGIEDFFSKTYKRIMHVNSLGYGFMFEPKYFIMAGKYIRSYFLGSIEKEYLQRNFGGLKWYKNRESWDFLKPLYSVGDKFTAEEMARRIGYDGLDINPLLKDLEQTLYL